MKELLSMKEVELRLYEFVESGVDPVDSYVEASARRRI